MAIVSRELWTVWRSVTNSLDKSIASVNPWLGWADRAVRVFMSESLGVVLLSFITEPFMLETTLSSLNGLPAFLAYFAMAIVLLLVFIRIYSWVTPHDELALIRANNSAAALAFGGALIGFALPLSSAITNAMSLLDCAVWGAVALVIQVLTFVALRLAITQLPERINQGEIATGSVVAASAIAVGLINAACMTY